MTSSKPHISICLCTYQRPVMLARLLRELGKQRTDNLFTYSVVICDNDADASAQIAVDPLLVELNYRASVVVQPLKNIAMARNTSVRNATGDFIAFIDDDEFPESDWLLNHFKTLTQTNASGALGPVVPHFDQSPPGWVINGKFYHRPRHATGFRMGWSECRTGNVLFKRQIISGLESPFDPQFATGGEDQDFFRRLVERGEEFVWCDEAVVFETVPPDRWNIRIMLSRALLRGKNSLRHRQGRVLRTFKSLLAAPAYSLALPFAMMFGRHRAIKLLMKLGDHYGRLLAIVGLNPVTERKA